ncbi:MAG: trypsin-like peptidase domain-containing protein [Ornithinimicrobium sp.]|uniref:S1C family serine protease n=1 Tax=Ornithinimicrobium sp. TaxID=1977084 RepID=UPI0026E01178|nr:trypsin-like peptidase domain-containing protein [Ornithinimicrobium sp.]MDO5739102.1 trypsin-like peptidase domain-containing protein [Ornithinimicrobium sp.]
MTDPTALIPQPQPRTEVRRRRGAPIVLASLVAGLVGGLGGGVLVQTVAPQPVSSRAQAPPLTPAQPVTSVPVEGTIPALSRAALPSVALISLGPGGRDGQGSGFVIREDGYVLTNHHVIAASTSGGGITVQLPGLEPASAEIVGSDSIYDIAVLRVDLSGLVPLMFADSEVVEVGQTVVAVGAPLGLDSTVTSGIVSALDRPVVTGGVADQSYISAIQTDAAINPGNSGGPLLDLAGRVVGVNSAIAQVPSTVGVPSGSIGLGFAIPAEQAERTAIQIIETGKSQHPVMGVHIDLHYTGEGARVLPESRDGIDPVLPDGPADVAGVKPGDIIVAVDGKRITDSTHLLVVLRSHAIGESVEMVLRGADGAERSVSMRLAGSGD